MPKQYDKTTSMKADGTDKTTSMKVDGTGEIRMTARLDAKTTAGMIGETRQHYDTKTETTTKIMTSLIKLCYPEKTREDECTRKLALLGEDYLAGTREETYMVVGTIYFAGTQERT